jgi:hypothetical protein
VKRRDIVGGVLSLSLVGCLRFSDSGETTVDTAASTTEATRTPLGPVASAEMTVRVGTGTAGERPVRVGNPGSAAVDAEQTMPLTLLP